MGTSLSVSECVHRINCAACARGMWRVWGEQVAIGHARNVLILSSDAGKLGDEEYKVCFDGGEVPGGFDQGSFRRK